MSSSMSQDKPVTTAYLKNVSEFMKGGEDDESSSMSRSNDKAQAVKYEQMKALFEKYKVGEFAEDSSATISISKSHD